VGLAIMIAILACIALLRVIIYRAPGSVGDGASGAGTHSIEWSWPTGEIAIYRWTPLAISIIVGSSLGVSGTLLQALLRNPLASPFILGISSGAALGIVAASYVGYAYDVDSLRAGNNTVPAVIGALLTLGVVYGLGQRGGWLDPISLVLIGVIVAAICGAGIMFFQHLVPYGLRGDLATWMMGSIRQGVGATTMIACGSIAGAGIAVSALMGRAMDAATLGDDEARSVGLSLGSLRAWMFILAGVLAAMSVALAGPIGFVGLIAPHAARMLLGPRHTDVVLGAAMLGAAVVVAADVSSQIFSIGGGRMPAGIFTAIVGGPAFIWLLRSWRGQS
jgi:iron complex transport system permease protein